jgi:hypothetical protein
MSVWQEKLLSWTIWDFSRLLLFLEINLLQSLIKCPQRTSIPARTTSDDAILKCTGCSFFAEFLNKNCFIRYCHCGLFNRDVHPNWTTWTGLQKSICLHSPKTKFCYQILLKTVNIKCTNGYWKETHHIPIRIETNGDVYCKNEFIQHPESNVTQTATCAVRGEVRDDVDSKVCNPTGIWCDETGPS